MLSVKNFSIKLKDQEYSFNQQEQKKYLLKNINFRVEKNEIHCLLGKNGSGKTSLACALMGLDKNKIEKGKIFFNNKDITHKKTHERALLGLTLAFQEPVRIEGLSVRDFLLAGRKKEKEGNLEEILNLVGLKKKFLERRLDEKLSGGERKRIELASIIAMKPKLMILDEPDASLDIIVYNELYDLLLKIKQKLKCSILLITHREEAGLIANRASLMEEGEIKKSGHFREIMRMYCERSGRKKQCRLIKEMGF